MKQHLIGLTGFAGTGKDTVADLLVTHAGFRKLAFADALRAEVAQGFGIDARRLSEPSTKSLATPALALRRGPQAFVAALVLALSQHHDDQPPAVSAAWLDEPRSPRQILQWWGTEYRREQDSRYWTRVMLSRLVNYRRLGETRHVITDVRFDNEADLVRAASGTIWRITRPGLSGTAEGTHVSATDGERFAPDVTINNCHDLRHLQGVVLGEWAALDLGMPRGSVRVEVPAT